MFRFLLFPFAVIYGVVGYVRRCVFYRWGVFKRTSFDKSIICVGNISMGGTGKTPHTEYLVRLLRQNFRVATLSRGYKRKSSGFIVASNNHGVADIGDEPMQYFTGLGSDVVVAVDEKRVRGVGELFARFSELQVVVLDDAFQHLSIKAGLNIVLTDYFSPYTKDYLFPVGMLREHRSAADYADVIVVTKCPKILSPIIRSSIIEELNPKPHQRVFFSYFDYGELVPLTPVAERNMDKSVSQILLLTGIANPYPLKEYLSQKYVDVHELEYPDHHLYTNKDVAKISQMYNEIITSKKAVITTQKDAMRLLDPMIKPLIIDLPVYYVPLEVKFHHSDQSEFDKIILDYMASC